MPAVTMTITITITITIQQVNKMVVVQRRGDHCQSGQCDCKMQLFNVMPTNLYYTLLFDKQGSMESQNQKQKHQVLIKNEERSWERYYAFILPYYKEGTECSAGDDHVHVANSASSCFGITPNMGSLAPRGGASNVCDESKPYSDGALLSIEYASDDIQG